MPDFEIGVNVIMMLQRSRGWGEQPILSRGGQRGWDLLWEKAGSTRTTTGEGLAEFEGVYLTVPYYRSVAQRPYRSWGLTLPGHGRLAAAALWSAPNLPPPFSLGDPAFMAGRRSPHQHRSSHSGSGRARIPRRGGTSSTWPRPPSPSAVQCTAHPPALYLK